MRFPVAVCGTAILTVLAGCDGQRTLVAPPPVEWTAHLSLGGFQMVSTADGKLAVCGYRQTEKNRAVPAIALVDGDGREVWSRAYDDVGVQTFGWIDATWDGGFVAVGSTGQWALNESDIGVARLDAKG